MLSNVYAPKVYCVGLKSTITKDCTFLGFRRTEAFAELRRTLLAGLLDKSIFWATELYISNLGPRLWEMLCIFASQEVNLTNPNLPALVWQCYEHHHVATESDTSKKEPFHDHQILRNHLTQLVAVITLSHKAKLPKLTSWKADQSLSLHKYRNRIRRDSLHTIRDVVKISDSPDIYVALNELDWALGVHADASASRVHFLFWLNWLAETERRHKMTVYCAPRVVPGIPDKCRTHICWVVWQIVFKAMDAKGAGVGLTSAVTSLYKLFRTDYTPARRRTRSAYLIHAALLVIGSVPALNFGQSVIPKASAVLVACANINQFYKRVVDQKREDKEETQEEPEKPIPNRPVLYLPCRPKGKHKTPPNSTKGMPHAHPPQTGKT